MVFKQVNVAIGLVCQKDKILLGWRDESLHQGGCFEFPGGKVEQNETPEQAVIRELQEETGLDVKIIRLFQEENYEYPDRHVHLSFYLCHTDQCLSKDHQQIWKWVECDRLKDFEFPAANQKIIDRLVWQRSLAIVLDRSQSVHQDVGLAYLKIAFQSVQEIQETVDAYYGRNIKLILNMKYYQQLDEVSQKKIFAIHLNSQQLHDYQAKPEILQNVNMIAACHHEQDILQAEKIGCDAILLSPVHFTSSHPDQQGMGWEKFQSLIATTNVRVYALGGVKRDNLNLAQSYGAYGVAGITDFLN